MRRVALALLVATTLAPAAVAAPEPIVACVDRYIVKLKPAVVDLATVRTYGKACADLVQQQNDGDYAAVSTDVLVNQRFNTNVLLWMVVLITLAGTALAGVQLYWSYQLALAGKGDLSSGSEVNVSNNSLAVRSSVVGVLILGLSLIFFIVFVWKVYPITLLGGDGDPGNVGEVGTVTDAAPATPAVPADATAKPAGPATP